MPTAVFSILVVGYTTRKKDVINKCIYKLRKKGKKIRLHKKLVKKTCT